MLEKNFKERNDWTVLFSGEISYWVLLGQAFGVHLGNSLGTAMLVSHCLVLCAKITGVV